MTGVAEEPRPANPAAKLRPWLLVAGALVFLGILPFLSGLVGSLILYTITRSAHQRLSRIVPPRISAIAIAVSVVGLLLLAGTWLVSTIVVEASETIGAWRPDQALAWLSRTPFVGVDVTKDVAGAATAVLGWLSNRAGAVVGGVTSFGVNILIALFGLYYLLLDGESVLKRVKQLLPVPATTVDLIVARFATVTEALLLGTVLTAMLQGTIVGIGFALVGLQPAVLWGFVTACVSVLPVFGSAIVWLPGIVALLLDHRLGAALLLTAIGAGLASNIDNVVRPLVYRRVSGIHPMLTLVGAFAGIRVFGLIGVFIGPLVLSYFVELLDVYDAAVRRAGPADPPPSIPLGLRQL
jgi:predicted PurR-regulated permease PerM